VATSILLSEQNSELALEVSDEGYIMRLGETDGIRCAIRRGAESF
jgi:ABC-type branched-subunit amino acid transport system ATPase component